MRSLSEDPRLCTPPPWTDAYCLVSSPGQEYHLLSPKAAPRSSGTASCPHCQPVRSEDTGRGWDPGWPHCSLLLGPMWLALP